jgi:hypothetical protein
MKRLLPGLILGALAACDGSRPSNPGGKAVLTLGPLSFEVGVYSAERDRRQATTRLPAAREGEGHLLAYARDRYLKVEGQDAPASFDAAFISRAGQVVDLQPLRAGDAPGILSAAEAAFVLLVAPGSLAKAGIQKGASAVLPPQALQAAELPLVRLGSAVAHVELALTDADKNHGLMFRSRMSADDGMLFAYPDEGMRSYWMANTLIPLDIAFLDKDGILLNVVETPCYPDPRNPPPNYHTANSLKPARYVLEMNLGWFKRKGLVDGSGRPAPGLRAELPREAVLGRFDP